MTFVACTMLMLTVSARAQVPTPKLDARSFLLVDHHTGTVLAEKNPDERVEPASLTKIMTVYTAAHALEAGMIALEDMVVVSEKAWRTEGSRMFIEVGKKVSVDDLLQGIIVQSGNDASVALAEHVSGTEDVFASIMSQHAKDLGMQNSSFANSTGLPHPETYTTARDMATLTSALVRKFPGLYARFAIEEFTFNDIRQPNRNPLLARDESVDGVKTGHTEAAGFCLVASADRNGMRLISVVMGTSSRTVRAEASQALINFGYRFYETRRIYDASDVVATPRLWRGEADTLDVGPSGPIFVTFPRGRYDDLEATAELDEPIAAPLTSGSGVGRMTIRLEDQVISEFPLVARADAPEGSFFGRVYDDLMLLFE